MLESKGTLPLKAKWATFPKKLPAQNNIFTINLVISKLFPKWCSSVANAFTCYEAIDFTGFSGTFQYPAVADEKYFYHSYYIPS